MWYCQIAIVLIVIVDVVVKINATLDITVSEYEGIESSKLDKRQKRDSFYIFNGKRVRDSTPQAVFPQSCDYKSTPGRCLGASFTNSNNERLFVKVNIGGTTLTKPQWQQLPVDRSKITHSLTTNVGVPLRMAYGSTQQRQATVKTVNGRNERFRNNPFKTLRLKSSKIFKNFSTNKNTRQRFTSNQTERNRIAKAIKMTPSQKTTTEVLRTTKLSTIDQVSQFLLQESRLARISPPQFDIKRFREELTAYHNAYRSKHGSPSLIYDATLERAAQNWAIVLGKRRDCLVHENPRRYGENLFYFGAQQFPNPTTLAHLVTYSFYMEGRGYDYNKFYPMSYYKTGHFTQLIWRESRRIGVGVSIVYHNGTKRGPCQPFTPLYMIYVVVKYDPPGNLQSYSSYMNNVKSPIA